MRLAGIHPSACVCGVAGKALGSLPSNTVPPSGHIAYTPPAPTPYPSLPRAGINHQTPWGSAPGALIPYQNMELPPGYTPSYATSGGGMQSSGGGRVQIQGLSGYLPTPFPFPFDIVQPTLTSNLNWWTGYPLQNKGTPRFQNDAEEYLRAALVESNWDGVEKWMAWAINNGLTLDQLRTFPFGKYKWVNGPSGTRKQLPFSDEDYRTFFERFLKYTATAPVTARCISDRVGYMRDQARVYVGNRYQLAIGDCVVHGSIAEGLMELAAFYAAAVGVAMLATAAAGALATGGTTAASGTAAASGTGAGTVAAGTSAATVAIPAGVEVVTVVAPAISAGGSVAAGVAAGAIVAAAQPPAIAPSPPATSPPEIPVIETVVTEASAITPVSAVTAGTIGAGLATGAISVIPEAPPITPETPSSDIIEEVTVEAQQPPPVIPITPAEALVTGVTSIALTQPIINVPEPTLPEIDTEPTLAETVTTGIQDAIASVGADLVLAELEQYLEDLLGRSPTSTEVDEWEDWINGGGVTPPPNVAGTTPPWTYWILGVAIAYALYEYSRTPKKRRKVRH